MTPPIIDHLRLAAAVLWFVACGALVLPAARALLWREPADPWKAVTFFCGFLFCAFPSRAMVRPADESAREALFILSILLALLVVGLVWREWWERQR